MFLYYQDMGRSSTVLALQRPKDVKFGATAVALINNHNNLVGVPIHDPDVAWRCGHQSKIKIYRSTECCKEKVPAKRICVVMLLRLWW